MEFTIEQIESLLKKMLEPITTIAQNLETSVKDLNGTVNKLEEKYDKLERKYDKLLDETEVARHYTEMAKRVGGRPRFLPQGEGIATRSTYTDKVVRIPYHMTVR